MPPVVKPPIPTPPPPPKAASATPPTPPPPPKAAAASTPDPEDVLRERNRQVAKLLAGKLEILNAQWSAVEKSLREMQLPRYVSVTYKEHQLDPNDYNSPSGWEVLALERYRGEWRLCHGYGNDCEDAPPVTKPITECSLEERVEAAEQIDSLRLAIIKAAEDYVPKVEAASSKLAFVLSKLQ